MGRAEIDYLYHFAYPIAQSAGLLGRWSLSAKEHLKLIDNLVDRRKLARVMLCGTATERNATDLVKSLSRNGEADRKVVTVDLNWYPLIRTDKNLMPVRADAQALPFERGSFDVITTDFLLNMLSLNALIATAQSWEHALNDKGIITTTVYSNDNERIYQKLYKWGSNRLADKYFYTPEILALVFQSAGLEMKLWKAKLAKRPFFYLSEHYGHLFAKKIDSENREDLAKQARAVLDSARLISDISYSETNLSPRTFEEVLADILDGQYIILKEQEQIVGFARVKQIAAGWSELGCLYVFNSYRGHGQGECLIRLMIEKAESNNIVSFTNNPAVTDVFQHLGLNKSSFTSLPGRLKYSLILDRMNSWDRLKYALPGIGEKRVKEVWVREMPDEIAKTVIEKFYE